MKGNKGITLIALVVTIIVLLILAGISIAMLTGENGILGDAQKSKSENALYGAEERMKLAYMAVRTEIAAQTVKNSSYNALHNTAADTSVTPNIPAVNNPEALLEIVKTDLNDDNWYAEVSSGGNKIIMTYRDSAIDNTVANQKGSVNGEITLTSQGASFQFNTSTASNTATVSSAP